MNMLSRIPALSLLAVVALTLSAACTSTTKSTVRRNAEDVNREGIKDLKAEKYTEAEAHFLKAIQFDPKFGSPHFGMGAVRSGQGRWAEAIPYYQKFLKLDRLPYSPAHSELGYAYLNTKQYPQAKVALTRALEINPDNAQAYFALAQYYAATGEDWIAADYNLTQAEARKIEIPGELRTRIRNGLAAAQAAAAAGQRG